ncbi:MAG: P-loop NTPase fold protein [Nitrospira sp.]|nr:P-loop NTPase fold protein [Nitrospira sp.]MDE0487348.1 P-loop NTPase fold protein [Nitrospira sp.]
MSPDKKPVSIPGDNPIQEPKCDVLGRLDTAKSFSRQVLELDVSEGVAVGVFGPWGSGKTSFINLAKTEFKQAGIPILDFNPWMFSGTEQLVKRFFAELTAQFKIRADLVEIGQSLENFSEMLSGTAWVPIVGPWTERLSMTMKLLYKLFQRQKEGIVECRDRVRKAIEDLDKPIVVVLDDVDRLSRSEIRDIFKLVRLTASFPNLIYIIVCDRILVEQALDEQGFSGRDYLEKILQLPFDLPKVPRHLLHEQINAAIKDALDGIENPGPFDKKVWEDVYPDLVGPLIHNIRDVRRYAAAIRGTVAGLNGQVALADVLGLEAVRIFLPDVFNLLPGAIDGLTATASSLSNSRIADEFVERYRNPAVEPHVHRKKQIEALIETAKPRDGVVKGMFHRLFPVAWHHIRDTELGDRYQQLVSEQLKERRVGHECYLRFYLERVVGHDLLVFADAERAFALMADYEALEKFIRSLAPMRWQYVIFYLKEFRDRFALEHVNPGIIVLLNLLPDLPVNNVAWHEARMIVWSVIRILLDLLNGPDAVKDAVQRILPKLPWFSSKIDLVRRLESQTGLDEFRRRLRDEIRSASVDDLAKDRNLAEVFEFAKNNLDPLENSLDINDSPKLTFALLRSVQTEGNSGLLGDRAVHRSTDLQWNRLVDLYESDAVLRERIESLSKQFEDLKPWITESLKMSPDDAESLFNLVQKYASRQHPISND